MGAPAQGGLWGSVGWGAQPLPPSRPPVPGAGDGRGLQGRCAPERGLICSDSCSDLKAPIPMCPRAPLFQRVHLIVCGLWEHTPQRACARRSEGNPGVSSVGSGGGCQLSHPVPLRVLKPRRPTAQRRSAERCKRGGGGWATRRPPLGAPTRTRRTQDQRGGLSPQDTQHRARPRGRRCACPADNRIRLMRAEPLARGARAAGSPHPRVLTIWLGRETEAGNPSFPNPKFGLRS